jgi:hypothetical protein
MEHADGAGGKILGAQTQVAVTRIELSPVIYVRLVNDAIGVPLGQTCIQIIDGLSGRALHSPMTLVFARKLIGDLQQYIDGVTSEGGNDGESTLHGG